MFFETIRIKNDKIYNLPWHQKRVDRTTSRFGLQKLDLSRIKINKVQKSRCKITYGKSIKIEYNELKSREIKKLKVVQKDIKYCFKSTSRSELDTIYNQRKNCDDVLIIKNGLISDTTIANIAFFDGTRWITPRVPLLKGTMRARLLNSGFLHAKTIRYEEVDRLWLVALMNAIIGFRIVGLAKDILER